MLRFVIYILAAAVLAFAFAASLQTAQNLQRWQFYRACGISAATLDEPVQACSIPR